MRGSSIPGPLQYLHEKLLCGGNEVHRKYQSVQEIINITKSFPFIEDYFEKDEEFNDKLRTKLYVANSVFNRKVL